MAKIDNGFDVISTITSITKYIPKIGALISTLQRTINVAKGPFGSAYSRVKTIDSKVYPYKKKADDGVDKCELGKL